MDNSQISNYLFLEDQDQKGDVAMVFGIRDWVDPLEKALELYQTQKVPLILFTGGKNRNSGEEEARNMYNEALRRGIPAGNLLLEDQANNTLENVLFSRKIIEEKGLLQDIRTVCAVMANVHARRALMTLKGNFPKNLTFRSCPYIYKRFGISKDNWMNSELGNRVVHDELNKIKTYLAKGDIEEI